MQAADSHGEGGEAKVGLGLAAPRGEEQQLSLTRGQLPPVRIRESGVGEAGQAEQDEGELEGTPAVVTRRVQLLEKLGDAGLRPRCAGAYELASHPLPGHGLVGEAERLQCHRVGAQEIDRSVEPRGHCAGPLQRGLGDVGVTLDLGVGGQPTLLLGEPGRVERGQGAEPMGQLVGVEIGAAEAGHVEDDAGNGARLHEGHLRGRETRRAQPPGA